MPLAPLHRRAAWLRYTERKDLPPVTPVLEEIIKQMGGERAEVALVPHEVEEAIKNAVKAAVKVAVWTSSKMR